MQFVEGGATGPNGRDSRAVRSSEQDPAHNPAGESPDAAGGGGSLMSRYRGAGPVPGAEDQATPPPAPATASRPAPTPPLPRTGEQAGAPGAPADSAWRDSNWTSAPPVPPMRAPSVPAPSSPAVTPPAPPASTPPPSATSTPAPPATSTPAPPASAPAPAAVPAPPGDKPVDRPADKPADTPAEKAVETPKPDAPRPAAPETDAPPAVTVTRGTTVTKSGLLSTDRTGEFKERWRDLQADFVDDPQQAVRGAGELARDVLAALSATIADAERVESWKAEDGTSGTEDLRVALRQYRTLVDRLLEL